MGQSKAVDFTRRPLQMTDAPRIAALIGNWEVVRWLSGPPFPYTVADATEFLATVMPGQAPAPERTQAISVDGQLAGMIGIDRRRDGLNLGYWLGQPYWERGIMTRAAMALTREFFANSAETHLMSGYFSGNEASWAIQRKLGFDFAGDGLLLNRPHGTRLPHVMTRLTRASFEARGVARG